MPVMEDAYYVVMPQAHPLAEEPVVRKEQLKGQPFILPEEGGNHPAIRGLVSSLDVQSDFTPGIHDDYMTLSLVRQGWGISIVPGLYRINEPAGLVFCKLEGSAARTLGLLTNGESQLSPALKAFMEYAPQWLKDHNYHRV